MIMWPEDNEVILAINAGIDITDYKSCIWKKACI